VSSPKATLMVRTGSGAEYAVLPCPRCAGEIEKRAAVNGHSAVRLNSIYGCASADRDPLDHEERGPQARALHRCLARHGMAREDLPELRADGQVAAIYRPFALCDRCQAQLAEFTDIDGGIVFLSPELETRLARFVDPRRGKLSRAARDEIQALTEVAIWPIGRLIAPRVGWSWDYPENWLDERASSR